MFGYTVTKICILSSVHIALDNRVFYREAKSLRRADYDVTLIAIHPRSEIKEGIKIIGLPQFPRWQRPRLWRRLLQQARAENADLYHFHDPELLLVTPWLRLLTQKPTIYDVHEVYADFIKVKDYLPVWEKFYDEKGKLMREMFFKEIKKFGKREIPSTLELIPTHKKGQKTLVRYLEAEFDIPIAKETFSLRNLRTRI